MNSKSELMPGHIVSGRFKIIRLLGRGGFAETYLAEDKHGLNKRCAVKRFISNDPKTLPKAKDLFEREARVLSDLNDYHNEHIPDFIAFLNENEELYLVEEFVDGSTLKDELYDKTKLEEDVVADILLDVLQALKLIHGQGKIHRDIKPDNIMRRKKDARTVLIDFGAVKEVVTQLSPGTQIYTNGYTPPEQRQGEAKSNSDIYALGMTAIEAIAGLSPQTLTRNNAGEVILPDQVQISESFAKILNKMVDKDYKRRYQSADDVFDAVQKFQDTVLAVPGQRQSTTIGQPTQIQESGFLSKLPMWLFGLILAPLVMVVAFLGGLSIVSNSPSTSPDVPKPKQEVTPEPSKDGPPQQDPDVKDGQQTQEDKQEESEDSGDLFRRPKPLE